MSFGGTGGGSSRISTSADVALSNPAEGQILTYDATLQKWQNTTLPSAPVSSVAGKTGAVALTASDVGLGNVDNTSDINKPISTAQQTALNAKVDKDVTITSDQSAPGWMMHLFTDYGADPSTSPEPLLFESSYSGSKYRVFWLNENGAPRAAASNTGEATMKIYGYQGGGQVVPLTIWYDKWGTPTPNILYAINKDGTPAIGRGNGNSVAQGSHTIVLGPSDPVPSGLPAGTVIVRKTS